MSYKFKSGDRVKVVNLRAETNRGKYNIEEGMTGKVIEDDSNRPWVEFDEEICSGRDGNSYRGSNRNRTMCMWEDEIDFISPVIKKLGLRNGDIITYRNDDKRIVDEKNKRLVYLTDFSRGALHFNNYDEDLFENGQNGNSQWDIVKVYRPMTEQTFRTERIKKVKEMTLEQVCKELGYEVKIIKEEK